MPTLTPAPTAVPARRRTPWALALSVYLTVAASLFTISALSSRRIAQPSLPRDMGWLDGWVRYDAGWYYAIAAHGYYYRTDAQSPVAFFPAYPLGMRGLGELLGNVYVAGVVLTAVCGLLVALMFLRWCSDQLPRSVAMAAFALLLVYPYSLYLYGAVYADALFVATALGAFVCLERGHPWLAGAVGALATASRPTGVAVLIGLSVRAVELAATRRAAATSGAAPAVAGLAVPSTGVPLLRSDWRSAVGDLHWDDVRIRANRGVSACRAALSAVRWRDGGVLVAASGLLSYCGYLWVRFGNPLAFLAAESYWDQGSGPRTWFKIQFFGTMVLGRAPDKLRLVFPALACLAVIALLPRVRRRFGWGYAVYTAVAVAIPVISTKDFMGSGRYLLAAFPAFAAAADLLTERPPWVLRLVLVTFAAGLIIAMVLFTRDYEVS